MVKAVVAGAAGGIGQPLSLLLKTSSLISELALYDVVNAPGVATGEPLLLPSISAQTHPTNTQLQT